MSSEIKTAPEENVAQQSLESEQKQPPTTAEIIAKLLDVRRERRRISARDKELIAEFRALESTLLVRLDEQGVEKASTTAGTATITETVLPQVTDWDAFYEWMTENDSLHLLQKRPAAAAFRELTDSGETIKGVVPYTQRAIGLREKT